MKLAEAKEIPFEPLAEEIPHPGGLAPNEFGPDTRGEFHVLKDGDLFAVFASNGDMNGPEGIAGEAQSKDGLFLRDTRMLSRLVLTLNQTQPIPMEAEVDDDAVLFRCDTANTRLIDSGGRVFESYQIHVSRERFLGVNYLHEVVELSNYSLQDAALDLVFDCYADYRDIFEVRGAERHVRGRHLAPRSTDNGVRFSYRTFDDIILSTEIAFDVPVVVRGSRIHLGLDIQAGQTAQVRFAVRVWQERDSRNDQGEAGHPDGSSADNFDQRVPDRAEALAAVRGRVGARVGRTRQITTDRPEFDAWLLRSSSDLAMLTAELPTGPYPHAGTPWFSVPFGRDGIIAAMQSLWLDPGLAAGVLEFLAKTQATETSEFRDAEPGKILHETRGGEMARAGEVPFELYYGGAGQTLLFVMLAGAYYRRTADLERIRRLEPSIRAALAWAREYGDKDGDGLIEYFRASDTGLKNQGWKDSEDAIFHADGKLCEGPIALVEIQAYQVAALRDGSELLAGLGHADEAAEMRLSAKSLAEKIDKEFWDDDLKSFCIGLDGNKDRIRVVSSNAGHMLFAGAVSEDRASQLAETLRAPSLLTGWGLRTIAAGAARYNPMGYHNGSIWPHDNSLIAAGLSRYGHTEDASRITTTLFDAACEFQHHRLPELWCGFDRREHGRPVAYPSACAPQAWAAGASFLCLASCLGLTVDAVNRIVHVRKPALPAAVSQLTISDLQIGGRGVDLRFVKQERGNTVLEVLHVPEGISVLIDGEEAPA